MVQIDDGVKGLTLVNVWFEAREERVGWITVLAVCGWATWATGRSEPIPVSDFTDVKMTPEKFVTDPEYAERYRTARIEAITNLYHRVAMMLGALEELVVRETTGDKRSDEQLAADAWNLIKRAKGEPPKPKEAYWEAWDVIALMRDRQRQHKAEKTIEHEYKRAGYGILAETRQMELLEPTTPIDQRG